MADRTKPLLSTTVKWLLGLIAASFLMSVTVAWTLDKDHEKRIHDGAASEAYVDKVEERISTRLDTISEDIKKILTTLGGVKEKATSASQDPPKKSE